MYMTVVVIQVRKFIILIVLVATLLATLTDKPYDVVITHGHPDHAGMMHQFDQVYINEKDLPMLP